ncbi:MAG: MarR family transcriptional regulator [Chloroflexi bacterium]|nr:MarR family transcriptional regulator [Chloroflexota bacterium]
MARAGRRSSKIAVVDHLKRGGPLPVQEIARALGITAVAVRKHLAALEADGLVERQVQRIPRGRPTYVYELTARAKDVFPQGYQQFAIDLLGEIVDREGREKLDYLFLARAQRLEQAYTNRLGDVGDDQKGFIERLRELARFRDEDGYMAALEETPDGFILREHNCPIYEVAQRFPQACSCEHDLFRRLLKSEIKRETSLLEGAPSCQFHIPGATQRQARDPA